MKWLMWIEAWIEAAIFVLFGRREGPLCPTCFCELAGDEHRVRCDTTVAWGDPADPSPDAADDVRVKPDGDVYICALQVMRRGKWLPVHRALQPQRRRSWPTARA